MPKQVAQAFRAEPLGRRYFDEVMNRGRLDVLREICAPGVQFSGPAAPRGVTGLDSVSELIASSRAGVDGLRFDVEVSVDGGASAAIAFFISGRHSGRFAGLDATGRRFGLRGVTVFEAGDSGLDRISACFDRLALLDQLGGVDPAAGAGR